MHRRHAWRRPTAVVALAALALGPSGCAYHRWRATPVTDVTLSEEKIEERRVRFTTDGGAVTLKTVRVAFPYVEGPAVEDSSVRVAVRLASVRRAEIVEAGARGTRRVPVALDAAGLAQLPGHTVRFETDRGPVRLRVTQIEPDVVLGTPLASPGSVRLDLREVRRMEVQEVDTLKAVAVSVGVLVGLAAAAYLVVLLTKESCPFVYVDRGDGYELVGEAYAGAAFRSIQRDDLLPLPALADGRVRVLLRNEARETQYTDEAALLLVDHAPGLRAVSTVDAKLALVGEASPPVDARNGAGDSVLASLAHDDRRSVETPPERLGERPPRDHDEIVARFGAAPAPQPVLEIVGGNTPWLDLVFGRFFATMGGRIDRYLSSANEATAAPGIRAWRQREGVDLTVDVLERGAWRQVAVVPTVGPIALRRVAVPLPPAPDGSGVTVRLRSGPGFWRIDQLALSARASSAATVERLAPLSATGPGRDPSDAEVAVTDGRYNALARMNDSLELSFDLPPLPTGQERSTFLFTNGYYNVHQPIQSRWAPATLRTISREPGGLARLSRDLAREYVRLARQHPAGETSGAPGAGDGR